MTRERIFEAARTLFAQEGPEGLSVRAVAREVGLSPMAMYRHFADKDALMDALLVDGFAAWEAMVASIEEPDPVVWLRAVTQAYLEFALGDPHRFDAAFLIPARGARQYPNDFKAGRSPAMQMVGARIEQARAEGRIGAAADPFGVALTVSALVQGLVSMQRAGRFADEAAFRAAYAMAMDTVFVVLAPRADKDGGTA
jgi:AcrR family transcriptional regulator